VDAAQGREATVTDEEWRARDVFAMVWEDRRPDEGRAREEAAYRRFARERRRQIINAVGLVRRGEFDSWSALIGLTVGWVEEDAIRGAVERALFGAGPGDN
jgi:hypothetical protein